MSDATGVAGDVAKVLSAHPDLPVILLTDDLGDMYDCHYSECRGATVERLLFADDVVETYGAPFGLEPGRVYDDESDVAERIVGSYLWDGLHGTDLCPAYSGESHREVNDNWIEVYDEVADAMAADMPWRDFVVIRGE